MTILYIILLLLPLICYLALGIGVLCLDVGFFFFLGAVGSFIIGAALASFLQAKTLKYSSGGAWLSLALGALVLGIGLTFAVREQSIGQRLTNEQEILMYVVRLLFVGLLWLDYYLFRATLLLSTPKLSKAENLKERIFPCAIREKSKAVYLLNVITTLSLAALLIWTLLLPWLNAPLLYNVCFFICAILSSVLNAFSTVSTNIHYHKKPFVFYAKIKDWDKPTSIFTDILVIALPIAVAIIIII